MFAARRQVTRPFSFQRNRIVAERERRRDVAAGADDFVGFRGGFAVGGGADDFDEALGLAFAALADDEIAGDDGRGDAALRKQAGHLPRDGAGLCVERGEADGAADGDELRRALLRREDAGGDGAVVGACAFPAPALGAGFGIEGDEEAGGAVGIEVEEDGAVVDHGRGAGAVLRIERAEVFFPKLAAIALIERGEAGAFGRQPGDIDALGIDGGRGAGVAVVGVLAKGAAALYSRCHAILPSAALTHARTRLPVPSGLQVTKTRSPQMTGEEWPLPGSAVFHWKSCAVICSGSFAWPMPEPFGPRKRVHS